MPTVSDEFDNLTFNSDELAFLKALADQTQGLNFFIILLGLSAIDTPPTTTADLIQTIADKVITIKAPTWLDALNGAQNIVAGTASQSIQLFILGSFPGPAGDMFGKKPQQQNVAFFNDLATQYTNMLNP